MRLPEARLDQHSVDTSKSLLQAIEQRREKPLQPSSDVQYAFLAGFKHAVIACSVIKDACGQGIEADGLMFALGQGQIGDGAG